jgi:hypothetical protein
VNSTAIVAMIQNPCVSYLKGAFPEGFGETRDRTAP